MSSLKITQVKSTIGNKPNARESVRSLGLKRIHQVVVVPDNAVNRGYVRSARHLLTVEAVEQELTATQDSVGNDHQ